MSVCVCVTRRYYIVMAAWIILVFAYRFPSTCPTQCFRDIIWKIRVHPLELCSKLWTCKIWLWHVERRQAQYKRHSSACWAYIYNIWRWRWTWPSVFNIDRRSSPINYIRRPALSTAWWSIWRTALVGVARSIGVSQPIYLFRATFGYGSKVPMMKPCTCLLQF